MTEWTIKNQNLKIHHKSESHIETLPVYHTTHSHTVGKN